jgi:16S rRNA G966 N2-methylase RsmD
MQKNIVFGVNSAMAAESSRQEKTTTLSDSDKESLSTIRQELETLREENSQFAAAMEEIRAQNEELKGKIEQLLSSGASKKRSKKATSQKGK